MIGEARFIQESHRVCDNWRSGGAIGRVVDAARTGRSRLRVACPAGLKGTPLSLVLEDLDPPLRRPGETRQRPAELSLTPRIPPANWPSSKLASSAPDFWKDQAAAQKTLQRRRRLTDELELRNAVVQKLDDLGVLARMGRAGRGCRRRSAARPRSAREGRRAGRGQQDDGRRTRSTPTPSSPSIPAPAGPSRRTGPRCCCGCISNGPSAEDSSAK